MVGVQACESAKRWTKNIDIFAKDILFVPIHDQLHWSLALIFFPGAILDQRNPARVPAILHLDSLKGGHHIDVIKGPLLNFLEAEWKAKRGADAMDAEGRPLVFDPKEFCLHTVPVPQQNNHTDCGLFLLKFVEETLLW